ncbi:hypothetical protein LXL04_019757 [Taraxacum kok-saghyz]
MYTAFGCVVVGLKDRAKHGPCTLSKALVEDEDWAKPTCAPSRAVDVRREVHGVREVARCRRTLHAASVARELGAFVFSKARVRVRSSWTDLVGRAPFLGQEGAVAIRVSLGAPP